MEAQYVIEVDLKSIVWISDRKTTQSFTKETNFVFLTTHPSLSLSSIDAVLNEIQSVKYNIIIASQRRKKKRRKINGLFKCFIDYLGLQLTR